MPGRRALNPSWRCVTVVAHVARLARDLGPDVDHRTRAGSWPAPVRGIWRTWLWCPPTPPAVLGPGQIRVAIRAAGLNFRDVVVALGAIADEGLGGEAAGVVIETAADVTGFQPGDAVMGLFPHNAFAPTAITDERMVVAIPAGWSFTAAASVPVAFLTAYIALVEIARACVRGREVLIHAGAGGVGQAAIQIAGHLGAQVFATAHPTKHARSAEPGSARHAYRLVTHPGFR